MPNNDLPLFEEQTQLINEEQLSLSKLGWFKKPTSTSSNFIKIELKEGSYCGTTNSKWDKPLCERYGFDYQGEWFQIDIPHALMEKLELEKGKDITWPLYLDPQVLKKKPTHGGITIEYKIEEGGELKKGYKFTISWFKQCRTMWKNTACRWKELLIDQLHLESKKINVLEIGVFEGRSTVWLLDNLFKNSESKLVAVDLFGEFLPGHDHEKIFRENIEKSGKAEQVEIIKGDSHAALAILNYETFIKEKRELFDLIYVDGCHGSRIVSRDAVSSWELLKEGGIMIFDDYEWDNMEEEYNNPRIAIDAFLKTHQTQIELIYKHYQVAIKKVIRKMPRTERKDRIVY